MVHGQVIRDSLQGHGVPWAEPLGGPGGVQPHLGSDLNRELVGAGKRAEPEQESAGAQAGLQFRSIVSLPC